MNLTEAQRREPTNNWLNMLGRLKPGATLEQADAEVQVAWSAFLKEQAAGVPEKSARALSVSVPRVPRR